MDDRTTSSEERATAARRAPSEDRARRVRCAVAIVVLASLAACAHQPRPLPFGNVPGFWNGLGHGIVAPIAFVVSLFKDVRIYAFPNSGVWYDLGFLLGIAAWGGGAARGSRRS
jgi:hypothetical protein